MIEVHSSQHDRVSAAARAAHIDIESRSETVRSLVEAIDPSPSEQALSSEEVKGNLTEGNGTGQVSSNAFTLAGVPGFGSPADASATIRRSTRSGLRAAV